MKVKTCDLIDRGLNYAVMMAEGVKPKIAAGLLHVAKDFENPDLLVVDVYSPSTNWMQGGPIIQRNRINTKHELPGGHWSSYIAFEPPSIWGSGPTLLIAAMRCYVSLKLGGEVEIPEELM